jgi:DNA polymerase-3 subunit gamma/tau
MATQSLYRRYRPRRFAEVKGQDHVVNALRNAVIHHREGQAYLFSGPRGTGKTTSARILAKVLNCERPVDGEPCCECESCLAVERGTSYDVHELDAASNNGVEAMRDLIEKAALGTPGRHKVYILDEVHMLSKAAEAALLKTLEEPPPHVVFVLATTDPQKVSETIRSRTQHLAFHLLPMDVLEAHIRWLAADAGITIGDEALESVLQRGGGSARDTVSALELVAAGGGEPLDSVPLDEFLESLIEHDPARGLTMVAHAVHNGREPRVLTEDLLRLLRDCFLSLMAPELVQLPSSRQVEVSELAQRVGAGPLVKAMERLGEILVEMRHAPDPRVLLEVAVVQLTHRSLGVDVGGLVERLERLEQAMAAGAAAAAPPAPVDPTTGRVVVGGRAQRAAARAAETSSRGIPRPAVVDNPPLAPVETSGADEPVDPAHATGHPSVDAAADRPAGGPPPGGAGQGSAALVAQAAALWPEIRPTLKALAKALFAKSEVAGERDGALALTAPNEAHLAKCREVQADVEKAIAGRVGATVRVVMVIGDGHDDGDDVLGNVVPIRPSAVMADDEIDPDDIVDAPPDDVVTPLDRLKQAFPGSTVVDE